MTDLPRKGRVCGLGVGPGDPELITVKALRLLRSATVVAYPVTEGKPGLARGIVAEWLAPAQIELLIPVPMRVERAPAQAAYDRAAAEIASHLDVGRDVAVLCEGDPFFYGSFMYLFGRLAARHTVEVVPGVSSLGASAAAVGLPLAARDDVLTVIPAPLPAEVIRARLDSADAAAILKVGRHLGKVRAVLAAAGLLEAAHYVERATQPGQRVLPLSSVDGDTAPYFSTILVHRRGKAWEWTGA